MRKTFTVGPQVQQATVIGSETGKQGFTKRVFYVGQGNIRRRIRDHRHHIQAHPRGREGDLRVTWALVESEDERSGIERYLANELEPRFGKHWPAVEPIPVNLPELA